MTIQKKLLFGFLGKALLVALVGAASVYSLSLRHAIENLALSHNDDPVQVTCSFGVSNFGEIVPPSVVELVDSALYRAKNSGRNRVELILAAAA